MNRLLACVIFCCFATAAHASRDRFVLEGGLGLGPVRSATINVDHIPTGPDTRLAVGWNVAVGGYVSESVSLALRVGGLVDRAALMTTTLAGPHVRYTRDRLWFGGGLGWGTAFGFRGRGSFDSLANTLGLGACARVGVEVVRHRFATMSIGVEATATAFAPEAGPSPGPLSIILGINYEVR